VSIKLFTPEEIEILQANPYVKKASEKTVTYTKELKEYFWEEYQKGRPPSAIMRSAGFEPRMLGQDRVLNLKKHCMKYANRPEGMQDLRQTQSGRRITRELSLEEENQKLKQKIKYLEQENEFLKKIEFAEKKVDMEQSRKKNSKLSKK
jgi:hypothetical protein